MTREKILSKVKDLKGFRKDQLEEEVRKAVAAAEAERRKLEAMERTFSEASKDCVAKQEAGRITMRELELTSSYLLQFGRQIEQQKHVVAKKQAVVEACRAAMVEAHREHKVVEKLHDRVVTAERRRAEKHEQKQADERYLNAKREG